MVVFVFIAVVAENLQHVCYYSTPLKTGGLQRSQKVTGTVSIGLLTSLKNRVPGARRQVKRSRDRITPERPRSFELSPRRGSSTSTVDSYLANSSSSSSSSYTDASSSDSSPRQCARSAEHTLVNDQSDETATRDQLGIALRSARHTLVNDLHVATTAANVRQDIALKKAQNTLSRAIFSALFVRLLYQEEARIRMKEIADQGLPAEERKVMEDKYNIPENCLFIDSARLNVEIKSSLPKAVASRDDRMVAKQAKLAVAISALASLTAKLLANEEIEKVKHLGILSDCCRILINAQRDESLTRRALILPHLNLSVREYIEKETTVDEWLFGTNLEDKFRLC
ncbi:unnamed protein product [Trichogramma brassicae]|uniref:Uncharacterized protein n=1 Tax=Trichogramma brassicae TaxID=86971 RepID=A0A6H5I774_9HYME|nr:unnamed protein product [Trichogramma brassicae]